MQDIFVIVRRQPSDHRTAKYLLSSFENPHWDTVSGGIRTTLFNQQFIYGYVQCTDAVEGEVAHSGEHGIDNHGPCPHRIKVCALKKDNKGVYNTLLEIVGPKPKSSELRFSMSTVKKFYFKTTYKEAILSFLNNKGSSSENDIIGYLFRYPLCGNNIGAMRAALTKLVREGLITCDNDSKDRQNNVYKIVKQ